MSHEELFDLIFTGELIAGADLIQTKKNVQMLFKLDDVKVNLLFAGKPVPIKKGLTATEANQYRVALKKAGALVETRMNTTLQTAGSDVKRTLDKIAEPLLSVAQPTNIPEISTTLPQTPRVMAPNLDLAPAGADILNAHEKRHYESKHLDLSHLALNPAEGNLIKEGEVHLQKPVNIVIPTYEVLEPGSDLLEGNEKMRVVPVDVDISALSLGVLGERLAPIGAEAVSSPNTDHLSLAENI